MTLDQVYEITDFRQPPRGERVGLLQFVPNGLLLWGQHSVPDQLEWNDDDPEAFRDDHAEGRISIMTPTGRVELERVTEASRENLEPFLNIPVGADIAQALKNQILGF